MLPDRVLNPEPLTNESGALPIALRGSAPGLIWFKRIYFDSFTTCITYYNMQIFRIRTKAYCLFSSSPIFFFLV